MHGQLAAAATYSSKSCNNNCSRDPSAFKCNLFDVAKLIAPKRSETREPHIKSSKMRVCCCRCHCCCRSAVAVAFAAREQHLLAASIGCNICCNFLWHLSCPESRLTVLNKHFLNFPRRPRRLNRKEITHEPHDQIVELAFAHS